MKKITINNQAYYYSKKTGFLFYDYRGEKQVPFSILSVNQYREFIKQIHK